MLEAKCARSKLDEIGNDDYSKNQGENTVYKLFTIICIHIKIIFHHHIIKNIKKIHGIIIIYLIYEKYFKYLYKNIINMMVLMLNC